MTNDFPGDTMRKKAGMVHCFRCGRAVTVNVVYGDVRGQTLQEGDVPAALADRVKCSECKRAGR